MPVAEVHRCRAVLLAVLSLAACVLPLKRAQADIRVEIEGVDGDVRRNVLALLSLERYKDRDRIEPAAVQRLYNRIDGEVRSALRPYGYYEPKIVAMLQPLEQDRHWRVHISIEPGTPVMLQAVSISVQGSGADDPAFKALTEAPPLRAGERLNHAAYEQLKGNLERTAATYGYLDARMLRSELLVDPAAHTARVFLTLQTGERYYFGATTIDRTNVRESQLRRYLRYKEGEPYNAIKLLRTQFAFDDSQYFSSVEVLAGERDSTHHIVPISIHTSSARRGYSFGVGYGTDTGARGTASWTVPRVNSLGHRFRVLTQLSQIKQTVETRYDIPFGDPALEKFSLVGLAQQAQINGSVSTAEVSATPGITQAIGRWERVLSTTVAHDVTTDDFDGRRVDNLIVPTIVYASVPEGYLGETLFSRGLYGQLLGSSTPLGARTNFLRLDLQAERVFELSPRWHLLLRSELGAIAIHHVEDMPGEYRFFAGGDRSVRGFAYNDLSPIAISPVTGAAVKIGGRDLITGTVELERDLPRNFGVAVFADGGNAVNNFGDPLAFSAGIGVRLRLPVVTVGIDIAQAVRAPGFATLPGPRLHLNISPKL
jgi:translocation and assembly module TamA